MKDNNKKKGISVCTVINILVAVVFFVLEIISSTVFQDQLVNRLVCRVLSRGIFGLLVIYNACYLLFTSGTAFIWGSLKPKQRTFSGVALAVVGLGLVVTALLGYGVNSDPILMWWE